MDFTCYRCGQAGHVRAECPFPAAHSPTPAPPPSSAPDLPYQAPVQTPCQRTRRWITYWARGRQTRLAMGWGLEPVVHTPFRERMRMMPKTEGQLRALALEQAAEHRAALSVASRT